MNYDNWKLETPPSHDENLHVCIKCDDTLINNDIDGFCDNVCYSNYVNDMVNAIVTLSTPEKELEIAMDFIKKENIELYKEVIEIRNNELKQK